MSQRHQGRRAISGVSMKREELGQPGILAGVPQHGRYLTFGLSTDSGSAIRAALGVLQPHVNGLDTVIGLGMSTLEALGRADTALVDFPALVAGDVVVPSTPAALFLWLRGSDPGELLHRSRACVSAVEAAFELVSTLDSFMYDGGRDLTGYEDGTENPVGDTAVETAFSPDGGSYLAVQKWVHDLNHFNSLPVGDRDNIIGRRIVDNEEIEEAPESAHVKRTAQEDFEPEAFMLRRSMPWATGQEAGLMFVCFANSLNPFNQQMARMVGKDDGIVDGLFRFSRPLTGAFFWCPPVKNGTFDL